VAQKVLHEFWVYALPEQERSAGVPKVVKTECLRKSGPLDADLEHPVEVAPTNEGPDLEGEYEAVINSEPGLPHALF
jgi:hypothetical protein